MEVGNGVSVHEQHICEMSGSEIQSRFGRASLYYHIYNERKGSGKCERVEEYGSVTLEGCAFLGGATTFCLKPSEGERAERCAHPPPCRRRRFGASAGIFRKF